MRSATAHAPAAPKFAPQCKKSKLSDVMMRGEPRSMVMTASGEPTEGVAPTPGARRLELDAASQQQRADRTSTTGEPTTETRMGHR